MIESNEIGLVWKYEFETMKIRCAHVTVQLVDRQGRDVKGIVSLQLRWHRVPNALTQIFLCVGFLFILELVVLKNGPRKDKNSIKF